MPRGRIVGPGVDDDLVEAERRRELPQLRGDLVGGADIADANRECPVTDRYDKLPKRASFRAQPGTVPFLRDAGFDVLDLANNHSTDCGRPGLVDTMEWLRHDGLRWCGAGASRAESEKPTIVSANGLRVAFVSFSDWLPEGVFPLDDRPTIALASPERAAEAVGRAASDADAVVVGFHRTFDFDGLVRATRAVQRGARLIGTNDDATYPTPDGPIPGGGSILAAVETACGRRAQVAGKPHEPMAALVIAEVGEAGARAAVMVGDRPSTDGLFARTLGCRYAQVWSGVTPRGTAVDPLPDMEADDLAGVAEALVTGQYFRR